MMSFGVKVPELANHNKGAYSCLYGIVYGGNKKMLCLKKIKSIFREIKFFIVILFI